jgi:hypothetical protein
MICWSNYRHGGPIRCRNRPTVHVTDYITDDSWGTKGKGHQLCKVCADELIDEVRLRNDGGRYRYFCLVRNLEESDAR